MAMREYEVEVNGISHTVQMDEDEAAERGLSEAKSQTSANKSRTTSNK